MNKPITIREAVTQQDIAFFWEQMHAYHKRDMFLNPEDEDRAYFLDDAQYRSEIEKLHGGEQNRCYYLLFCRCEERIGFALPAIFRTEDGKCFLMEFCVFPEFRGNGTGSQCAGGFLTWAKEKGAQYFGINCDTARRQRFWQRVGFVFNGADEWGVPLMLLPPEDERPITVAVLTDSEARQLRKLENGYLSELGEDILTEEKQKALSRAIAQGRITFFIAKRGCRFVGMCSVVTDSSELACAEVGTFENLYVEPSFRKQGIARKLVKFARQWCKEKGISGLSVTCAPCGEKMFNKLGFQVTLGKACACIE